MTADQLDQLCAQAMTRLMHWINYSAGQHIRRMKEGWK